MSPTRLEAAKAAARGFVERQPSSIRIGVVAFGESGLITQAPTTAQADVLAAIDRLTPQGGTALGRGIQTSLSAIVGKTVQLDESGGTARPRARTWATSALRRWFCSPTARTPSARTRWTSPSWPPRLA